MTEATPPLTFHDALRVLWRRSSYERGQIADAFADPARAQRGLDRMEALLARLGDPQRSVPVVHVAGSKGKGSTVAMVDAVARAAGLRTGRYTSPHLHSFRERIALDGEPVTEDAFAALARRVVAAGEALEAERPDLGLATTFDVLTAMAFVAFAERPPDVAVVEVGLGGTFDSANLVAPVVAAITRIDLEHTAILGETIEEIAAQKAGIIKAGRPVVIGPQPPGAGEVFARVAAERGSDRYAAGRDWFTSGGWSGFEAVGPWGRWSELALGLRAAYQVENAGVAVAVAWSLGRAGFPIAERDVRAGLAGVRWPGRFERVDLASGATVLLDGAHTPAAAAALAASFRVEFPGRRAIVVCGVAADKPLPAILAALAPIAAKIVGTASAGPRSTQPDRVASAATELGLSAVAAETVAAALDAALTEAGARVVVATGSLFVVAEARTALGLAVTDPWPP